ncbi:hypothetical protein TCDM_13627 [Trypanosoma cruzi Dm28c]|uniref:Uncharacterized protein n=1 Tax=Trypanosoma cruzi Dm28c TaxID=1416333 RepID=V5CHU0_TRYCR|nr:hypothetical protein TCDM_13627 [Trypanosoma cruzi Dm28c]
MHAAKPFDLLRDPAANATAQNRTRKQRHPRRTAIKSHTNSTSTMATRETERIQFCGTVLCFSPPRRAIVTLRSRLRCVTPHTHSEARCTPSAPLRTLSTGRRPVTLAPSQLRNANNRRRGPSMPLAEKEKRSGHFSSTASRGKVNGKQRQQLEEGTAQNNTSRSGLPKKREKKGESRAEFHKSKKKFEN